MFLMLYKDRVKIEIHPEQWSCCTDPHMCNKESRGISKQYKITNADPSKSLCTASARCVSSSRTTWSPTAARQSSTEVSGLAGLNTSDVCRSKPVVEKAADTQNTGQSDTSDRENSSRKKNAGGKIRSHFMKAV